MTHLQVETQNSKTRIKYLELPEKPFFKDLPEALSKGIEVHPQSMELAETLIRNYLYPTEKKSDSIPDGLYPVSVRVKEKIDCLNFCDGECLYGHNGGCWGSQKYAILEEIKDDKWSQLEDSGLDKKLETWDKKMEAPDAEKIIRDWFIGLPQPSNGGKYVFTYNELIKLLTDGSGQVLSSLRKEVEAELDSIPSFRSVERARCEWFISLIDKHLNP